MSNFNPSESRGNSIFRGQPNHSYFDKPFEDEEDCLFQMLNEIDPFFLQPQQQAESINVLNITVTDPRTQLPINQLCYDYTKEQETKIFRSHKKSLMNKNQHELGVRVLNLLQQCLEVEEEDMYNWYRMQRIREKEAELFQKYVLEYNQNIKEQMYAPCRKLLQLYQKWYKSKAFKLMRRYPEETYNTHLGLPQVRQCKNVLSDLQVRIINQEIVRTVGDQCCWQDSIKEEINKFNSSIGSYADVYENAEDIRDSLEDNLQSQFVKMAEQEMGECPYFYMPLESLLFVLTAGDYVDIPTEMLLNIKETENSAGDFIKYIVMDLPLPSRQCGWHTYKQIVEQATIAVASIKQTKSIKKTNSESEIVSHNFIGFKVQTLQDFMEKSRFTADKLCKFSKTLTKWQLATLEDDQHFQIFTSVDGFIENKSVVLKLEYKPNFGCEILTKYEALKEWFKLKLIGASESDCLRIDVTNYQTLLEQPLNIRILEECLSSVYHINCEELLNSLFEFLKMLYNMPSGQYMLRYSPKYKEKLLLCKPSQEITKNTINLHQLLNTDVTDIQFMSQQNFLPIDENLCSLMHLQHKNLPAAFSPSVDGTKIFYKNQAFVPRPKYKPVLPKKEYKKPISNKTRKKRIRRIKRQYEAMKEKANISDAMALEKEMELDRKMLNF